MIHAEYELDIPPEYADHRGMFSSGECVPHHVRRSTTGNRRAGTHRDIFANIVIATCVASFHEYADRLERVRLQQKFRRLAMEWSRDAAHYSSIEDMCMHPAYQRIIGMGPKVVPLILRELERCPDHWFWALASITEEDPVPEESWGRIDEMTSAWLKWGRENGFSW